MSRLDLRRLRSLVAELRAQRIAAMAVPLAAKALRDAGFRLPSDNYQGAQAGAELLVVEEAPGLDAKIEELRREGIDPLVVIIRSFESEPFDGARDADGGAGGDRGRQADASAAPAPATSPRRSRKGAH